MTDTPSIENCFDIYAQVIISGTINPWHEAEQRRAFFCGFHSCLEVIDSIAFENYQMKGDDPTGMEALHAEYERFATQHDCGDTSINH